MGMPWSRVVNTTIKNYIREEEINVLRNRKLTALLHDRGRFEMNVSGWALDWKVEYNTLRPTPYADGDALQFSRIDREKTATLDWRGYTMQDSMTKGEFLANSGKEAIVKLFSTRTEKLVDNIGQYFGEELYVNGYAAGNTKRIHGIQSFTGSVNSVTSALTNLTAKAGSGVAWPTATYAGLSTAPGNYNGNWENPSTTLVWPHGRGDNRYDFWSPIIVDYGSTYFSSTATWEANCVKALAFAIIKSKKSQSKKGKLDLFLLDDTMYEQYINQYRPNERVLVQRAAAESGLLKLGFTDVINQDGVDVTWEYGIPSGTGFGFNVDMMEVKSQQSQLFVAMGPDEDIKTKSWLWSVDFFGNVVFNPKFFVALFNVTNPTGTV